MRADQHNPVVVGPMYPPAAVNPTKTDNKRAGNDRWRPCRLAVVAVIVTLVVVMFATGALYITYWHWHSDSNLPQPVFQVKSLTFSNFNISGVSPLTTITATSEIGMSVRNPSRDHTCVYAPMAVVIYYKTQSLTSAEMRRFEQGGNTERLVMLRGDVTERRFELGGGNKGTFAQLGEDLKSGFVKFDVVLGDWYFGDSIGMGHPDSVKASCLNVEVSFSPRPPFGFVGAMVDGPNPRLGAFEFDYY